MKKKVKKRNPAVLNLAVQVDRLIGQYNKAAAKVSKWAVIGDLQRLRKTKEYQLAVGKKSL